MPQTIDLEGKSYVVIPREEYDRLSLAARLPQLPEPDEQSNYPAVEYARASLARKLILRREALGLSKAELARRAGLRVETLNRIESGQVTPSVASVDKLDRVLKAVESARERTTARRARKR